MKLLHKLVFLTLCLLPSVSFAQTAMLPCVQIPGTLFSSCAPVTSTNPLPVTLSGSISSGVTIGTSASLTNPQKTGDATTGLYSDAPGQVKISTSGSQAVAVGTQGMTVGSPTGSFEGAGTINATNLYINGVAVSGGGGSSAISIGTTTITGGTNTRVLFNNAGVAGEYAISGTGSVAMTNSPAFVTPALGTPASGVATNLTGTAAGLTAGTVTTNANLTGPITSSGNTTAIAAQTGTGSVFAVQTSPNFTTSISIGTSATINAINLSGTSAQTISMVRGTTIGSSMTIQAGGATSGGTDLAGGTLVLQGGVSTGTGSGLIQLNVFGGQATGSTDTTAQNVFSVVRNNSATTAQFRYDTAIKPKTDVTTANFTFTTDSNQNARGVLKIGGNGAYCAGGNDNNLYCGANTGGTIFWGAAGNTNTNFMQMTASQLSIGTTQIASTVNIAGNLSLGAAYNNTAAPTSGAIIAGNVGLGTSAIVSGSGTTISGHIGYAPTNVPVVSTCGSGTLTAGSTDNKGQITGITAATACTITFSSNLPVAPSCTFSTSTGIAAGASAISQAAVTTTMAALTGSLYYLCQ